MDERRRNVSLEVRLPYALADVAEELQETDSEFLSRIVTHGLLRRDHYRNLRQNYEERLQRPDDSNEYDTERQ